MPDYAFYTDAYLGEDLPEADFPRYAKRAAATLAHSNQVFRVSPREGIPDAEDNALCAIDVYKRQTQLCGHAAACPRSGGGTQSV